MKMTDLSPAARAVLEVAGDYTPVKIDARLGAAAILRAAADLVAPNDYNPPRGASYYPEAGAFEDGKCVRNEDIRSQLLAIAHELEALDD
jgi:hypothetical protein